MVPSQDLAPLTTEWEELPQEIFSCFVCKYTMGKPHVKNAISAGRPIGDATGESSSTPHGVRSYVSDI